MNSRIQTLRAKTRQKEVCLSHERARLVTDFYKTHVSMNESVPVQRALCLQYILEKKIRLAGGSHSIMLKLPAEKLTTKMGIVLKADRSHVLEFKPFYKHHKQHATTFLCTIAGYNVFLDGKPMVVWNRKS